MLWSRTSLPRCRAKVRDYKPMLAPNEALCAGSVSFMCTQQGAAIVGCLAMPCIEEQSRRAQILR